MTEKTQMTELEIIEDLQTHLSKDDRLYLARMEKADLGILHHFFGQQIRNSYGLWLSNPITETWRTDETSRKIINDIDCSEDHPDAVSMRIIEKLWTRLRRWTLKHQGETYVYRGKPAIPLNQTGVATAPSGKTLTLKCDKGDLKQVTQPRKPK